MRRTSREVTDFDQMVEIMQRCDVCRLAFNDDEYPYILPLNFALKVEGQTVTLYFHGANEGRKYELLRRNSHVSFEMDCDHQLFSIPEQHYCTMEYASIIGHGRLEIVPDEEKWAALAAINNHFHPEGFAVNEASVPRTTVMKLTVLGMTGKRHKK